MRPKILVVADERAAAETIEYARRISSARASPPFPLGGRQLFGLCGARLQASGALPALSARHVRADVRFS